METKIKTIIVIDNLCVGGIATSLYNFLHFTQRWLECDLLVFDPESVDMNRIPEGVRVLKSSSTLKILGKSQREINDDSCFYAILRAFLVLTSRVFSGEFSRKILFSCKKIQGYDLAISFAQDNGWKSLSKGCNDFVIDRIKAKYKIAFIHCDYSNYGGYDSRQEKVLSKFDSIACVSESCRNSFISMFPNLCKKSIVCENFTDIEDIVRQSEPAIIYPENSISFVTVCRLSTVKGLERTIKAFAELYSDGYDNFYWNIVGDGPEKEKLISLVKQNNLSDKIWFSGNQPNPYPYMKNASVFLLPSLNEAAPMVYGESAALGVPVLTTQTCSAIEMIEKRKWGFVVENSYDGIKNGIKFILENNALLKEIQINEATINQNAYQSVEFIVCKVKSL